MRPGLIIKMLRIAEGLSQKDLADKLDVSRSYLSLVENEKKTPGLPLLRVTAQYFGIPVALLFVEPDGEDSIIFNELQKILGNVLAAKVRLNQEDSA